MRNRTGIEDWILEKANYRYEGSGQTFTFPYDLGTWENIKQVADPSCAPIGDGIHWKVRSGCNQYTLTVKKNHNQFGTNFWFSEWIIFWMQKYCSRSSKLRKKKRNVPECEHTTYEKRPLDHGYHFGHTDPLSLWIHHALMSQESS